MPVERLGTRRLRWVFLVLALGLLLPLGLLLRKALQSVEVERAMRHRAVAERVVDEMERELSAWLRREEDRPFAHYRYFVVPEGGASKVLDLDRSPLAAPAAEPFVVGYFQIDPDGTVSSPRWPGNETLARNLFGWQPADDVRDQVERVRRAVAGFWDAASPAVADLGRVTAKDDAKLQSAGTTIPLAPQEKKAWAKKKAQPEPEAPSPAISVLEQLNRGIASRRDRAAKVEESEAPEVYNFARDETNLLQSVVETRQLRAAAEAEDQRRLQTEALADDESTRRERAKYIQ